MNTETIKETRELIYQNQLKWFQQYKDLLSTGKVLVVGHGLGYTTQIISSINENVAALDVGLESGALLKDKVRVYDGLQMPYGDNEFDAVVVTYVLHHAVNVAQLFNEIVRVSKSKIIILDETYQNFFQKFDLVYYCWYFNRKAGQHVDIHWDSYLSHERLMELGKEANLKLDLHKTEPMRSYQTELTVFSK